MSNFPARVNREAPSSRRLVPARPNRELEERIAALSGRPSTTLAFGTETGHLGKLAEHFVVFGAGDITTAHKTDECLPRSQLDECTATLRTLRNLPPVTTIMRANRRIFRGLQQAGRQPRRRLGYAQCRDYPNCVHRKMQQLPTQLDTMQASVSHPCASVASAPA